MMRGVIELKPKKTRKYADAYMTWYKSGRDTLIVHCPDADILKHARNAAIRFRERNELKGRISISRYEGDLYLMRIGDQSRAMDLYPRNDGWIFYYNET